MNRCMGLTALTAVPGGDADRNAVATRLRDARALVEQLEATRAALAQRLEAEDREDALQRATGLSSLDRAVDTARGIVRRLESLAGDDARAATANIAASRARA